MKTEEIASKDGNMTHKRIFSTGFVMGLADLVPGVSGGTVAFIGGIYDKLLDAIRTVTGTTLSHVSRFQIKKAWDSVPFGFLLALSGGILLALLSMSNVLEYLLDNHPIPTWSVFFGLVAGSIVVVRKRIKAWGLTVVAALIAGTIVTFMVAGSGFSLDTANPISYLLTGFIAFCAMILPGISGSLIMVLLGMYESVIEALASFDFVLLVLVATGGAIGLAAFSRLLGWLLKHRHDVTVAFLIGMMVGSLRRLWPWKSPADTGATDYLQTNILPDMGIGLAVAAALMLIAAALIIKAEYHLHAEKD
jgi:putative membrane protein